MEFYFSVADLLDKIPNKIGLTFIPIFVFTIFAEAIVIHGRHGNYSWKSCAYRKSSPSILAMQSTQDRTAQKASRCLGGT